MANRALELVGKELGMFVERSERTLDDKRDAHDWTRDDLVAILDWAFGDGVAASRSERRCGGTARAA